MLRRLDIYQQKDGQHRTPHKTDGMAGMPGSVFGSWAELFFILRFCSSGIEPRAPHLVGKSTSFYTSSKVYVVIYSRLIKLALSVHTHLCDGWRNRKQSRLSPLMFAETRCWLLTMTKSWVSLQLSVPMGPLTFLVVLLKLSICWAGEMAQRFRALPALPKAVSYTTLTLPTTRRV